MKTHSGRPVVTDSLRARVAGRVVFSPPHPRRQTPAWLIFGLWRQSYFAGGAEPVPAPPLSVCDDAHAQQIRPSERLPHT